MVSQTSSKWTPAALARQCKDFAAQNWGGHAPPVQEQLAWADLVYHVVYATALLNMMEAPEGVEEKAKTILHAVLTNPGENGNTDVDGGSVYRMMTCREVMSYINHGNGNCNQHCCISVYDQLERS